MDGLKPLYGGLLKIPAPLELSGNWCAHSCPYCFANLNAPTRTLDVKGVSKLLADYQNRNTFDKVNQAIGSGIRDRHFNISAPFHQDNGNVKDSVNLIFTRRKNSIGGSLNVPDYDITIKQANNSLLVYPAWANLHGVTPILPIQQGKDFYRNSFVFYPLACFEKLS